MATYQIIYWKNFPAQVKAKQGREVASGVLSERFQVAIDAAAMAEKSESEDAYLAGWKQGPAQERAGEPKEIVQQVLAELEEAYPPERLAAMVQASRNPLK